MFEHLNTNKKKNETVTKPNNKGGTPLKEFFYGLVGNCLYSYHEQVIF
jgi:hypothetical protein